MKRTLQICLLLGIFSLLNTACVIREYEGYARTVTVSATGSVNLSQDMIIAELALESPAKSASDAYFDYNQTLSAIQRALDAMSIPSANVYTYGYTVAQTSDAENPFTAQGYLAISLSNQQQISVAIDTALEAGAKRLNEVTYLHNGTEEAIKQARILAIHRAEEKAFTLASTSGATLGKPLKISEEAISLPEENGEDKVDVTVSVMYAIK